MGDLISRRPAAPAPLIGGQVIGGQDVAARQVEDLIAVVHGRCHGAQVDGQRDERFGGTRPERGGEFGGQFGIARKITFVQFIQAFASQFGVCSALGECGHEHVAGVLEHGLERASPKHTGIAVARVGGGAQPRQRLLVPLRHMIFVQTSTDIGARIQ